MLRCCVVGAAVVALSAPFAAASVSMDFVTVGNAGNAADPTTGFGSVGYEYRIGTYEVTNSQYAAFLNSVAAASPARAPMARSPTRCAETWATSP